MRIVMAACGALLLSGCASMNGQFDCPMKAGVVCQSLDQVNQSVDHGMLPTKGQPVAAKRMATTMQHRHFASYPMAPSFRQDDPIRYAERVQRIWVAPFVDLDGAYHQASVSFEVIDPGRWIGNPVHAVSE